MYMAFFVRFFTVYIIDQCSLYLEFYYRDVWQSNDVLVLEKAIIRVQSMKLSLIC